MSSGSRKTSIVNDDLLVIDGQEIKPGARISHFEVTKKLGQGAMASVFLAQDVDLQRNVALKFLNRSALATADTAMMQELLETRFIREARSAALISHQNIAKIYAADFQHENWYIVMEFIDGQEVQDIIDEGKKFTAVEILDFIKQICTGLDYAWGSSKLIHRDIKPQNIMLNNRGVYKLVDMGLAKPVVDEQEGLGLTTTGVPVGTPYYMAPEQAEGLPDLDQRADIFALGATIHEMCLGKKTFNERSAAMVYMAQMNRKYTPLPDERGDLPKGLVDLVDAMLTPRRDERIDEYPEILSSVSDCLKKLEADQKKEEEEAAKKTSAKAKRKTKSKAAAKRKKKNGKEKDFSEPTVKLSGEKIDKLKADGKRKKELKESSAGAEHDDKDALRRARKKLEDTKKEKAQPVPVEEEEEVPESVYDKDMDVADTYVVDPGMRDKDLADLIAEIRRRRNLPALDKNVLDLTNIVRKANSRVSDLTAVIQRDTSLSSNLISTINSSLYSPKNAIQNISAAVVLLGFDKVKSLATRLSIFSQTHRSLKDEKLYQLLTSAYFAGAFTQNLTTAAGYKNAEESFIAGLLHQMPRLILANTFPNRYKKVQAMVLDGTSFNRACIEVFNVEYPDICDGINRAWNLPPGIACSFSDNGGMNGKGYLRPYVKESCHLADMMFGQVIGGKQELAASEARIRKMLHRKDFDVKDFLVNSCTKDENVRHFFHMPEDAIERIVQDVEKGVAHKSDREREIQIDLDQPARVIPSAKRRFLDRCDAEIQELAHKKHDINKAIELAMDGVNQCAPSEHIVTVLYSTKRDRLVGRFYRGQIKDFDPTFIDIRVTEGRSKIVACAEDRKPVRCTGAKRNLRLPPLILQKLQMRQVMMIPIIVSEASIGMFLIGRSTNGKRFEDTELAQVEVLADSLAKVFKAVKEQRRKAARARK